MKTIWIPQVQKAKVAVSMSHSSPMFYFDHLFVFSVKIPQSDQEEHLKTGGVALKLHKIRGNSPVDFCKHTHRPLTIFATISCCSILIN